MEITNTLDLWLQLKKMGNFSDNYYDLAIINDLEKGLAITSNFEQCLKDILPETFLTAFFQAMSPLVSMYADILNFYERCKALSGTENIEIEFDLKQFKTTILNAAHFIKASEQLVRIKQTTQKLILTPEALRDLWGLPIERASERKSIKNETFLSWNGEYRGNHKEWPSIKLDFTSAIKGSPIQKTLSKAFCFWSELFHYYQSIPTPRDEWHKLLFSKQDQTSPNLSSELLSLEFDFCLGGILYNLYYLAENYLELSPEIKHDIDAQLDKFLKNFQFFDDYSDTVIPVWKNFLKLPVWKRRYEVYSVWVFTQIIADFPDENLTFHLKDGILSFPFSGACLATAKFGNKTFDFWTELRTKAIVKPIGKSRKASIQPDYSILCGDSDNIADSIAVIECKQYKKSSSINFSQSIIDYANNRPNAKVFLVDYGEINANNVTTKLHTLSSKRYMLMSLYRPESKCRMPLSRLICELVYQHSGIIKLNSNDIATFSLFWNNEPHDLDLHLFYRSYRSAVIQRLCFDSNEIEDAQYGGDITDGYGPENICIKKWHDGIYDLWVNNYSETPELSKSNALLSVVFQGSNQTLQIECPKEDSSQWWHLLKIDTLSCTVTIINKNEEINPIYC